MNSLDASGPQDFETPAYLFTRAVHTLITRGGAHGNNGAKKGVPPLITASGYRVCRRLAPVFLPLALGNTREGPRGRDLLLFHKKKNLRKMRDGNKSLARGVALSTAWVVVWGLVGW